MGKKKRGKLPQCANNYQLMEILMENGAISISRLFLTDSLPTRKIKFHSR